MSALLDQIKKKAVVELEYAGLRYRLKPVTTADLIQRHSALMAAVFPPSAASLMQQRAIEEATGEDKERLQQIQLLEIVKASNDPALQAEGLSLATDCLCAAVVEMSAEEGAWEAIKIVARAEDADAGATPPRICVQDLPVGTIQFVGGAARNLAFGGEEQRKQIRSFRGISNAAPAGEVG